MKYFIKKIMFFSVINVFLIVAFLLFISKIHQFYPSKMYFYNEFNTAFSEKDIEVLALGNSKLLCAIDKRLFEQSLGLKSAILGYASANISVSKLTLESYLNKCLVKPKLVLLEVSWFTFNNKRTVFHSITGDLFINDIKLWKNYFDYNFELFQNVRSAIFTSLKTLFNREQMNLSFEKNFQNNSPLTKDYIFETKDFEVIFPKHVAGIDELLLKDFESILNMCRESNIQLILFSAPEDKEYSQMQKDNKEIFHKTSLDYLNVIFLDYTLGGALWDKKYEMWLGNSHHINESDQFTKLLVRDIKASTHRIVD